MCVPAFVPVGVSINLCMYVLAVASILSAFVLSFFLAMF